MQAVSEAQTVLSYFELPEDDRPPDHIWGNDDLLRDWFDDVKLRRAHPDNQMERVPDEPAHGFTQNSLVDSLSHNTPVLPPGFND